LRAILQTKNSVIRVSASASLTKFLVYDAFEKLHITFVVKVRSYRSNFEWKFRKIRRF